MYPRPPKSGDKRKTANSAVPKLIDNKRKHLQRSLSSAQRDPLLINEAKDDASFRKELTKAMKESNETFSRSVESMSNSVNQLGDGICRSMEMLSRAIYMSNQVPRNQNLFYQTMAPPNMAPQRQGVNTYNQDVSIYENLYEAYKNFFSVILNQNEHLWLPNNMKLIDSVLTLTVGLSHLIFNMKCSTKIIRLVWYTGCTNVSLCLGLSEAEQKTLQFSYL